MAVNNDAKYRCCECGEELPGSCYYKSESPIFAGIGHLPICKDCLSREYKRYKIEYMNQRQAMQRICMMFDIYYDPALFDSCTGNEDKIVGNYIKKTNLGQCKMKTFDTTIEEGFNFNGAGTIYESTPPIDSDGRPVDQKLVTKWGGGLSLIDYDELEKHFKFLKNANPNSDSNQEIFIIDLCYTKMQQLKAVREGRVDDYNKLSDSYRKTFAQAGLKTVRDANASDNFLIGVSAEMIEMYTPAEYYKDKSLYKDHDNIGDYINRFLLRPLRNLMYGTNDRDHEYYVKEESDDGFTEDE